MSRETNRNGTDSALSLGAWKIRRWRKAEGMTARHVATLLGVTPPAVHFWETGKKVPRHSKLAQLQELGVCEPNDWHRPAPVSQAA